MLNPPATPRAEAEAHHAVDKAKQESGPVWWKDGEPDLNKLAVKNTVMANGTREKAVGEDRRCCR
jgi:hypothetical protein